MGFLSSRLRTWLLLAIALPPARLLVHRLAIATERHDPSTHRRNCSADRVGCDPGVRALLAQGQAIAIGCGLAYYLTYAEMMRRYSEAAGLRSRVLVPVPLLTYQQ